MMSTVDRARGQWPEVLAMLGVEERFLTGRHGPCPMCGGKDRFRFSDKDGDGWFYCNQCGPGSGILLLRRLHGWGHAKTCQEVDRVLGAEDRRLGRARPGRSDRAKAADIERLLRDADDQWVVDDWKSARRLHVSTPVLRGHRACPFYDSNHQLLDKFAAVIAPITTFDGRIVSAQRLYETDAIPPEERKKIMPPLGTIKGCAVYLHEFDDELGVAEGVSTAEAACELFGIPTCAALSANGLESWIWPPQIQRLHIFGDNDSNFRGQLATAKLAHRARHGPSPLEVRVNIPDEPDTDWLDVLHWEFDSDQR
jgi:putative DNA primase/helicase